MSLKNSQVVKDLEVVNALMYVLLQNKGQWGSLGSFLIAWEPHRHSKKRDLCLLYLIQAYLADSSEDKVYVPRMDPRVAEASLCMH